MSNVFAFKKNDGSQDRLLGLEKVEADLNDLLIREASTVFLVESESDPLNAEHRMLLSSLKAGAIQTATLMQKIGVYTAAKRGTLNRNQWAAGNHPSEAEKEARHLLQERLQALRAKNG